MNVKSQIKRAMLGAAATMALTAVAAPSQASTLLFASFDTGSSRANNFRFVNAGPSDSDSATVYTTATASATTAGAAAVRFSFFDDPALNDFFDLPAAFTFNGTVKDTPATFDGKTYTQTGINGSFKFVYTGATQTLDGFHLVKNSTVLFSGTFTDAWIQGNGGVGGIDVSVSNGGKATFSSAIYPISQFQAKTDEFSFHLATVTPNFARANASSALSSFRAHAAGDFQATIPEPASWALMITGFGAAGALLRRQRRALVAA